MNCSISSTLSSKSPSQRYHVLVRSFTLKPDPLQESVVKELDKLYESLQHYKPPPLPSEPDTDSSQSMGTFNVTPSSSSSSSSNQSSSASSTGGGGIFQRLFGGSSSDQKTETLSSSSSNPEPVTLHGVEVPKGLYIYGTTGTGKTMLMDLFYDSITMQSKERVHFNKFMLEIHDSIHQHTERLKRSGLSPQEMRRHDPIPAISLEIAKSSRVLCFDEFQVTDIVDAVLLNRLFTALFYYGTVCVATSNREPSQLYINGLQRQQVFVPFLDLFCKKMKVIDLNSMDYRDLGSTLKNIYFVDDDAGFETAWERMVEGDGAKHVEHSTTVEVMAGRTLECPRSVGHSKATRFQFDDLCARNLGSADYLALSKSFSTVFIEGVPQFGFLNRNEMKRFILLVDELYNHKNRVVISAAALPDKLLNVEMSESEREHKKTVFEDMFQFDRCTSRLHEMQSIEYLDDFKQYWRDQESTHVD